jgi:hypothetical protein
VKDLKCFDMMRFFASLRMTQSQKLTSYETVKVKLKEKNLDGKKALIVDYDINLAKSVLKNFTASGSALFMLQT